MTAHTTQRGVAAIALVGAVLSAPACSHDVTNRTAVDAQTSSSHARATATDASTTATVLGPTASVDELVEVDGGRLHVRCVGAGDTTVVLIAGFNDGGENWDRIEPALSRRARVCSYARFGTGTSDPPTAPQTFATSARDLHTVLSDVGEPGPYLVVGHSYGGAQAVTFAARYPNEVDGLVLLDATPPTWTAAGCAVPDDGTEAAADFVARCPVPTHPTDNPERLDEVAGFAEVAAIDTLGTLPLSVVTAAEHPFPGLDPIQATRLDDVWNRGQGHWMSLSSSSRLVTVDNTGHYIQLDRPDVAIAEVERLLPAPTTTAASATPPRWENCGGRLQCGSLDVPLDATDPAGPTVTLALARLPATDPDARIGTLITNPGGPGGSGVDFLGNDGPFNDEINRSFDIVSWDPRGVGGSAPLDCGSGFADTFLATDLAPRDAAGLAALDQSLGTAVKACTTATGALLGHIGIDAAVADLEAIRLALGDDQITYVGFSYGTVIGLRYAQRFPNGLRAMVLDGVVDPEQELGAQLVVAAASFDHALADILDACGLDCPIAGDPQQAFRDLAEAARTAPLRTGDDQDVAVNAVGLAGLAVTYDEELRAAFYEAIAQGQRGDGSVLDLFAHGFVDEFDLGPGFAVNCGDLPHPTTSADVEALAARAAGSATVLPELSGAYVRAFALPCTHWPVPAPAVLEAVTAPGAAPILVVGNTGDPVTPLESAQRIATTLEGRLLTYAGAGHTTYGKNDCADAHIDSYLLALTLPPESASCS
jgi:pimeloyl-ACP methyl ester carboxylesterase